MLIRKAMFFDVFLTIIEDINRSMGHFDVNYKQILKWNVNKRRTSIQGERINRATKSVFPNADR